MIIPFGWCYQENPLENIPDPDSQSFNTPDCQSLLLPEDEGISVKQDEDMLNDPNVRVIGMIERIEDEKIIIIDWLPNQYHDYLDPILQSQEKCILSNND